MTRWPAVLAALLLAAALALYLAPHAAAQGYGGLVQLVPLPNATQLSSRCITSSTWPGGPYTMANVTSASGLSIVIMPNPWNTKSGGGTISVSACKDYVEASVVNYNVTAVNPPLTVLGYPEVIYGYKPWGQVQTGESPLLELPERVGELPGILVYINYTVGFPNGRGDFAFDIWVTRAYRPKSVGYGDLEIMVWLYTTPDNSPMGYRAPNFTVALPTVINGTVVNATWGVYVARSIPWTYMAFALEPPVRSGYVVFPLSSILAAAAQEWSRLFNYSLYGMYLNDVEIGLEYSSIAWPPVGVNVSAWYKIYSYGFVVVPRGTATITATATVVSTTTAPPITTTSTTTVTVTATATATATATRTVGTATARSLEAALAIAIVAIVVLAVLLARRS